MYGGGTLMCKLSCSSEDSPEHILECQPLLLQLPPQAQIEASNMQYNFIFGSLSQQKKIANVICQLLEVRKQSTENS